MSLTTDRQEWQSRRALPNDPVWILVLAGGRGRRLAGFVRTTLCDTRPKQFCHILGRRSMIRHTWDRAVRLVPAERLVTIITAGQERYVAQEARSCGRIPGRVLVQPADRGTGPGLLLPLLWIARQQPDATAVVFPADQFVWEESRFLAHVADAVIESRRRPDRVVLLGVEPDRPETSYGWITPGVPRVGRLPNRELFAVADFVEKPDAARARQLQAAGGLWHTCVMAGTVFAFLQLARRTQPDALSVLETVTGNFGTSAAGAAIAQAYGRVPAFDVARDMLARERDALLVQPARGLTWADWGDANRILETVARIGQRPAWSAAAPRTLSGLHREAWIATAASVRHTGRLLDTDHHIG